MQSSVKIIDPVPSWRYVSSTYPFLFLYIILKWKIHNIELVNYIHYTIHKAAQLEVSEKR